MLKNLSYGIYALCTKVGEKVNGCIINAAIQVTSENPTIAVSLNKNNYTNEMIRQSKKFSLSIFSENSDRYIISRLGFCSGKDRDKFADISYELVENMPILKGEFSGYIICDVLEFISCNTHDIIIAKVLLQKEGTNDNIMSYKYYHDVIKGKAPKNAPTYME